MDKVKEQKEKLVKYFYESLKSHRPIVVYFTESTIEKYVCITNINEEKNTFEGWEMDEYRYKKKSVIKEYSFDRNMGFIK